MLGQNPRLRSAVDALLLRSCVVLVNGPTLRTQCHGVEMRCTKRNAEQLHPASIQASVDLCDWSRHLNGCRPKKTTSSLSEWSSDSTWGRHLFFFNPNSTKDKSRLHQFGTEMLPGKFFGYALHGGRGWTRILIIGDWHDIENNAASEVHVKSFKSKEVGIKKMLEACVFPCAGGSLRQEGHAQRQTLRHQRVERFDAGARHPHWARRGVTHCRVQGITLRQQEGGVADSAEADCDPWEVKGDSWSLSGN